ncbi:MAG: hypothetical protein AAFP70_02350 [Calditrichota bacterium]
MKRIATLLFLFASLSGGAQEVSVWDTLDVQYEVIDQRHYDGKVSLSIQLPPFLTQDEVKRQIEIAVQFPGSPPPNEVTEVFIYVEGRKDGKKVGRATYKPGKGFKWQIEKWDTDLSVVNYKLTPEDRYIYETLMDTLYSIDEFSLDTNHKRVKKAKKELAKRSKITLDELENLYYRVKWWQAQEERSQKSPGKSD